MTKQELMENYTMEQLAEMVIKYQNASEVKNDEIQKLKWTISNLEESNGRLQVRVDTYTDYLLPRCTKEAKELIDHNHFTRVRIVAIEDEKKCDYRNKNVDISNIQKCNDELEKFLKENPLHSSMEKICKDIVEQKNNAMAIEFTKVICELLRENGVYVHCVETRFNETITEKNFIEEKYGIYFDSVDFSEHDKKFADKIEKLKSQLDRKQTEINQIDEIIEKVTGVKADFENISKFENSLRETSCKLCDAHQLKYEVEKYKKAFEEAKNEKDCMVCEFQNEIDKLSSKTISDFLPTEPIKVADMLINVDHIWFDISELRQIAEHLLIYCNANGEGEE